MKENPFADFCGDIKVGRDQTPLGDGLRAYRMDGRLGMRRRAGLGDALSCCDYLRVDGEEFILIEETELWETVSTLEEEYNALKNDKSTRRKFVRERIKHENCLKVYGAMLVLCRMDRLGEKTRRMFWLVVSGDRGAARAFRHWDPNGDLQEEIKIALVGEEGRQAPIDGQLRGARLVADVKVMTADELRKKLSRRLDAK